MHLHLTIFLQINIKILGVTWYLDYKLDLYNLGVVVISDKETLEWYRLNLKRLNDMLNFIDKSVSFITHHYLF